MLQKIKIPLIFLFLFSLTSTVYAAPITSSFGWRTHPITGKWHFHKGLDIGYAENTNIVAMGTGKIVYAAWYDGYGNCVIIEHTNGDHTLYAHANALYCKYGQSVNKGDVIAAVGSTGNSTGPHLHIEYWHNGQYADPITLWSS